MDCAKTGCIPLAFRDSEKEGKTPIKLFFATNWLEALAERSFSAGSALAKKQLAGMREIISCAASSGFWEIGQSLPPSSKR
jgi:hypothetical protein